MASDELYKLAAEYDKRKLWREMSADQMFGVKLPDNRIAYCSVNGGNGFYLAVYVGTEGLNSYRNSEITFFDISNNEEFLLAVSQKGLQCRFERKDELSDEELAAEKSFSKRNKIYFRARFSHPRFLKFEPMILARKIDDAEDEKILALALSAAIEVGKKFPNHLPPKIKFENRPQLRRKFPLLIPDGEKFKWTMENFPMLRYVTYPEAKLKPKDLQKLSAAEKSGIYCCEIFALPGVVETNSGVEKFSVMLMNYDRTKEKAVPIKSAVDYISAPEKLTANIVKTFLKAGVPEKIFVRNERTFVFLENFCEQTGIELLETEDLPEIDDEEDSLLKELEIRTVSQDDFVMSLLNQIHQDSVVDLKTNLSVEIKALLAQLLEDDILSPHIANKITDILDD